MAYKSSIFKKTSNNTRELKWFFPCRLSIGDIMKMKRTWKDCLTQFDIKFRYFDDFGQKSRIKYPRNLIQEILNSLNLTFKKLLSVSHAFLTWLNGNILIQEVFISSYYFSLPLPKKNTKWIPRKFSKFKIRENKYPRKISKTKIRNLIPAKSKIFAIVKLSTREI